MHAAAALAALLSFGVNAAAPTPAGVSVQVNSSAASVASEPDYEEEKIQFQRGSVMLYSLPQIDASLRPLVPGGPATLSSRSAVVQGLQRAAAHAEPLAMVQLGLLHERGNGVAQDYHVAADWYRKAVTLGSPPASFLLGMVYWQAKGVPQDLQRASVHLLRAAQQGLVEAQVNRGWLCEYAPPPSQDLACARQWYEQAAAVGNATGAFNLGSLYLQGKGVARDLTLAAKWFLRAAAQGDAGAQYNLGVLALGTATTDTPTHSVDDGARPDLRAAYQWFRLAQLAHYPAATQSVRDAMRVLDARQIAEAELAVRYWHAIHAHTSGAAATP